MLTALSYQGVLRRGFALVRDEAGHAVRSVAALMPGQRLDVELADGTLTAEVHTAKARHADASQAGSLSDAPAPARGSAKLRKPPGDQGSLFE